MYRNGDFRRELVVVVSGPTARAQYANGRLRFVAQIEPKGVWHACLVAADHAHGVGRRPAALPCNAVAMPLRQPGSPAARRRAQHLEPGRPARVGPGGRGPRGAAARGPLVRARRRGPGGRRPVVRHPVRPRHAHRLDAGICGYPEFADGALRRLCALQATADDPERDMEPGKIPHEIRHGELAQTGCCRSRPTTGRTTPRRST